MSCNYLTPTCLKKKSMMTHSLPVQFANVSTDCLSVNELEYGNINTTASAKYRLHFKHACMYLCISFCRLLILTDSSCEQRRLRFEPLMIENAVTSRFSLETAQI